MSVAVAARHLLPKADCSFSECEDSIGLNLSTLRFAVSDGATEAFDSRRWARYLTRAWISARRPDAHDYELVDLIRPLGKHLERRWAGRRLPWYLEEKAAGGAFAAFLGLQLCEDGTWSAIALGDTCLIQERRDAQELAFPLSDPAEFSSRPILVASKTDAAATKTATRMTRGVCLAGDVFLLMSDAIACWYLANCQIDSELRPLFHASLGNKSAFAVLVEEERAARRLRNDDIAVLKLVIGAADHGG